MIRLNPQDFFAQAAGIVVLTVSLSTPLFCQHLHDRSAEKIAYYGTLSDGLAEAQRSGRPIFLVAAAPQCEGVPGIW